MLQFLGVVENEQSCTAQEFAASSSRRSEKAVKRGIWFESHKTRSAECGRRIWLSFFALCAKGCDEETNIACPYEKLLLQNEASLKPRSSSGRLPFNKLVELKIISRKNCFKTICMEKEFLRCTACWGKKGRKR